MKTLIKSHLITDVCFICTKAAISSTEVKATIVRPIYKQSVIRLRENSGEKSSCWMPREKAQLVCCQFLYKAFQGLSKGYFGRLGKATFRLSKCTQSKYSVIATSVMVVENHESQFSGRTISTGRGKHTAIKAQWTMLACVYGVSL